MTVNKKYKIIFIHIPKCGGCYITSRILPNEVRKVYYHSRICDILSLYPKFSNFEKFTVVRNPYSRLVSAYFFLIKGGFKNPTDLGYQKILKKYSNFQDFVLHLRKDELYKKIMHLRPITFFISSKDDQDKVLVDHIFHIEDMQEVEEFLTKHLNKKDGINIPITNQSKHNDDYMSYYTTEEMLSIVNRIYFRDFRIGKYSRIKKIE